MKKIYCIFMGLLMLLLVACSGKSGGQEAQSTRDREASKTKDYGVFIGIDRDKISRLEPYNTVVIEPTEFTEQDVIKLHDKGKTVYAYLNVGTIETFRPYYKDFKDMALENYRDWPDEYWIDVSQKEWQDCCVELAERIKAQGYDGFFVDNLDVYHYYPEKGIYDGICSILNRIKTMDTEVIINGAKEFVTSTFTMDGSQDLFDAVNQEEVFTRIDFDDATYHKQKAKETAILKEYLEKVKTEGYRVYLLEYAPSKLVLKRIKNYCKLKDYQYYCAPSLKLE